jgi:hypothetical protein
MHLFQGASPEKMMPAGGLAGRIGSQSPRYSAYIVHLTVENATVHDVV